MIENRPYFEPQDGAPENKIADIAAEFALCMKRGDSPDSPAAQSAVERLQACCTDCGRDLTDGKDFPFDAEICGTGTSDYISDAVAFYQKGR